MPYTPYTVPQTLGNTGFAGFHPLKLCRTRAVHTVHAIRSCRTTARYCCIPAWAASSSAWSSLSDACAPCGCPHRPLRRDAGDAGLRRIGRAARATDSLPYGHGAFAAGAGGIAGWRADVARKGALPVAEQATQSLPLVNKGRWHGKAMTEGIRTTDHREPYGDRQCPTTPQSAFG